MNWFLDQFVNGILQLSVSFVVFMTNQLVQPLGLSPEVALAYFPGISTFTECFKILALFITILIVLVQLMRSIFGEFSYAEKDNVVLLLFRSALAIVLIFTSMSVMSYLFNLFSEPFYILNDDTGKSAFNITNDENNVFDDSVNEAFSNFIKSAEEMNDKDYESAIATVSDWIFPGISILKAIVEIICILLIGYKFILFLIGILERYLILILQVFTSPLIWPSISSVNTVEIFKRWFEMFVANFFLIYFKMWILGLIVSSMGHIFSPQIAESFSGNWEPNFVLGSAILYVIIRIGENLDNTLSRLLSVSTTGAGLGQEMMASFRFFTNSFNTVKHLGSKVLPPGDGGAVEDPVESGDKEVFHYSKGDDSSNNSEKKDAFEESSAYKESQNGENAAQNANRDAFVDGLYSPSSIESRNELLDRLELPDTMTDEEFSTLSGVDNDVFRDELTKEGYAPYILTRGDSGLLTVDGLNSNGDIKEIATLVPIEEKDNDRYEGFKSLSGDNSSYLVLPETNAELSYSEPSRELLESSKELSLPDSEIETLTDDSKLETVPRYSGTDYAPEWLKPGESDE